MRSRSFANASCLLTALLAAVPAAGQITVEGLADQTVYADRAAFRVPAAAGFEDTILLDGEAVPGGVQVEVDRADYHELRVDRRPTGGGTVQTRLVQFIVRSTARGNSEWGLPPWVPYPPIDSAPAELAGARLDLIAPAAMPLGLEIPVVAWVRDATGKRLGVNGMVKAAGLPDLRLLRGVGSAFLPAQTSAGPLAHGASIHSLSAPRVVEIEASTAWTDVSGTLNGTVDWGMDARIRVTGDLTVAAGATLNVGAGSVVLIAPGADITVAGALTVEGSAERPVVFTPQARSSPWGGFVLRTAASRLTARWGIFTASGADDDWFGNNSGSGSSHRDEQCLVYLQNGARAELTDCALVDLAGQAGHGESSFLTMTRTLVQRCITAGQYNSGSVTLLDCALIEFPAWDAPFADDDNDGLYLTGGSHSLTGTLIGWALDDGVDSGSGTGGPVAVSNCWFESMYHEGMAWSEGRLPTVRDTVTTNNGQGIECGFGTPQVDAERILSTGNLSGARFGDNYDWDYDGSLRVRDSLLLHNYRDLWGRNWDDWTERLAQMDVQGNRLSVPHPSFPENAAWDPAADAARLVPFLPTPAGTVGVGLALRSPRLDPSRLAAGVPVRLSTFTTAPVTVDFTVDSEDGPLGSGTLRFDPGETVELIRPEIADISTLERVRVRIESPVGAEITGLAEAFLVQPATLVPLGSVWKYHNLGIDLGAAWRETDFADGAWQEGPAELGFGDDPQTEIDIGPSANRHRTIYFRHAFQVADPTAYESLRIELLRDDGAVVYLNGREVFRSNLPEGVEILYSTLTPDTTSSETAFFPRELGAEDLVAGKNVVAVEVHQAAADSSDLSFEMQLIGYPAPDLTPGFVRGDGNGDGSVDISDPLIVLFHLFAGLPASCADALDADDNGTVAMEDAITLLAHLFQEGPALPAPYPGKGTDPTPDALDCAES